MGSYANGLAKGKVGLTSLLPSQGPFPVADMFGVGLAIAIVLKLREPGHQGTHQPFETIRKLQASFSNMHMSSAAGLRSLRSAVGDKVKHYLTESLIHSLWFERFSQGYLC